MLIIAPRRGAPRMRCDAPNVAAAISTIVCEAESLWPGAYLLFVREQAFMTEQPARVSAMNYVTGTACRWSQRATKIT